MVRPLALDPSAQSLHVHSSPLQVYRDNLLHCCQSSQHSTLTHHETKDMLHTLLLVSWFVSDTQPKLNYFLTIAHHSSHMGTYPLCISS
jgi:hypothetical protein